jgi:DNA-binding winged helix-turn-helix (wHTH) protein
MIAAAGAEIGGCRIDLSVTPDFGLGDAQVRPARRQVCRGGKCHELEPRVMKVLVALARDRSEVVSRERLLGTCWNGRIVGDDAINRCIVALRHLASTMPPAPFAIETVARVGYYLVESPLACAQAPATGLSGARQPLDGIVSPLLRRIVSRAEVRPATLAAFVAGALMVVGIRFAWRQRLVFRCRNRTHGSPD